MSSRLARRCIRVCNCTFLMLQRTQRFRSASWHLWWVLEGLAMSLAVRRIGPIARRRRRDVAGIHLPLCQGVRLSAQLSQSLREERLNLIRCAQGAEAWNHLRAGEIPLVLGDLDEVADRRVAHPRLPQRSTGQRCRHALLQKGSDVAASNNGFDWWQARHIEGCCKRYFVCGGCRRGLGFGRSRAWLGGLAT